MGFPPRGEEFPSMSLVGPEKRVSHVRDRTLYPHSHTPVDMTVFQEKCLGEHLMDGIKKRLAEKGEKDMFLSFWYLS